MSVNVEVQLHEVAKVVARRAQELRHGLMELTGSSAELDWRGKAALSLEAPVAELAQRVEETGTLGGLPLAVRARLLRMGCACLAHVALLTDEDVKKLGLDTEAEAVVRRASQHALDILRVADAAALYQLPVIGVVRAALERFCPPRHGDYGATSTAESFAADSSADPAASTEDSLTVAAKHVEQDLKLHGAELQKLQTSDFLEIGILGSGSFGIVTLGKLERTGDVYALKHVSKGLIVKMGMEDKAVNERKILAMAAACPYIMQLYATINAADSLIYVLEACLGGELQQVYARNGLTGSAPHARFYAACISRGIAFLHYRNIVYRDLKPENVLLSQQGYAKLADLGLAKQLSGLTHTTCGSPKYFAPELIAKKGYGLAVDWWALGVLIFELLTGKTPFEASDVVQVYRKIIKGMTQVELPASFPVQAEDLVRSLCARDPKDRLQPSDAGANSFSMHVWFQGFDWQALDDQKLKPPFKPSVRNNMDLSNFCMPDEQALPPAYPYTDPGTGWDCDF